MNRKIGIVTLQGYDNYGNKLQNYALKKVVENLGFEVNTIIFKKRTSLIRLYQSNPKKFLNNVIGAFKNKSLKNKNNQKNEYLELKNMREKKFINFSTQYLNELTINFSDSSSEEIINQFSFFITGSDQVWHPDQFLKLDNFFLSFTPPSKRIAYSPSIAVEELPERYKKYYVDWLNGMEHLSVREEAGSRIIKDLTNREAPVHVDPTMLLSREEWLSVTKRAQNRPETPYILTYFLGGPSKKTRDKLERIATEKNMRIINLGDITDKETYTTGPSEFLDYINNASTFLTDSFHGVVYSIIFQTPFVVFERLSSGHSMYSRIETILNNFNMKAREATDFNGDLFSMDFSNAQTILEKEIMKSHNYLKNALRIEG